MFGIDRRLGRLHFAFGVVEAGIRFIKQPVDFLASLGKPRHFRIVFNLFDSPFQILDKRFRTDHIDFIPRHIRDQIRKILFRVHQVDALAHHAAATFGIGQSMMRFVKLFLQFRQIAFIDETDDRIHAFDAMETVHAGLDLTISLHLTAFVCGIVDGLHAQCVQTGRSGLFLQPSDKRRILTILQFRRYPTVFAGAIIALVHIHELPGAPDHQRRIDRADLRRESPLVAAVDKNGLRNRRIRDVHGGAPTFVALAHIHQLRRIRQFVRAQAHRLRDQRTSLIHRLGDAGPLPAFAIIVPAQLRTFLTGCGALADQTIPLGFQIPHAFVERFHGSGQCVAFRVPGRLVGWQCTFDTLEFLDDALTLRAHILHVASGAFQVIAQPLQGSAVNAFDAFDDGFALPVHIGDPLLCLVQVAFLLLHLAFGGGQSGSHFAGHARTHP